jgi:Domain of unknown function (DUF4190)
MGTPRGSDPSPSTPVAAPYPSGGYAYGQYSQRTTSGVAVASLVLSILWLCGVGSLLAVVLGVLARRDIARSNGARSGAGIALAGIILGLVGLGTVALFVVLGTAIGHSGPSS